MATSITITVVALIVSFLRREMTIITNRNPSFRGLQLPDADEGVCADGEVALRGDDDVLAGVAVAVVLEAGKVEDAADADAAVDGVHEDVELVEGADGAADDLPDGEEERDGAEGALAARERARGPHGARGLARLAHGDDGVERARGVVDAELALQAALLHDHAEHAPHAPARAVAQPREAPLALI